MEKQPHAHPRSRRVRLVIVDDHELARAGLRSLLSGERSLEVVGEATSGAEALDVCRQLQPDVVLLDVRMPDLDGLTVTRLLRRDVPNTVVLLFSMLEELALMTEWRTAGAAGFLLKGAGRREILAAIQQALRPGFQSRPPATHSEPPDRSISR
jgi:DNA-binding NarL/FixJ family response regulator